MTHDYEIEHGVPSFQRKHIATLALCIGFPILALGYSALDGTGGSSNRTVHAERFVLTDGRGNVRAVLESPGEGAATLAFHDKDGPSLAMRPLSILHPAPGQHLRGCR